MKRLLALLALALSALGANAATTYFCNCTGVGADGTCVNGSDATNSGASTIAGTTGPKQSLAAFKTAFAAAVAGDQLLLCQGGAWDSWAVKLAPANSALATQVANPIVIGSFSPTQFSSAAKPILNTPATLGSVTITGISKAVSAVVTAANTYVNSGDEYVQFGAITGMPEINGMQGVVSGATSTQFTVNVDTSQFATAGTTGTAKKTCYYNDTAGTCIAFLFRTNNATAYGGYTIQDLEINGSDLTGSYGINITDRAVGITTQRLNIHNVDGAWGCTNSPDASGGSPKQISLLNSAIDTTRGNGMNSWGCAQVTIDGNTINKAANAPKGHNAKLRDHAAYLSGNELLPSVSPTDTYVVVFRNNVITNTALNQVAETGNAADPTRCNGAIVVGHSRIQDWLFENNTFKQVAGTTSGGCYGLAITPANNDGAAYPEYAFRLVTRGNLFVNPGNVAIWHQACKDCLTENNVIVKDEAWDGFVGIFVSQATVPPGGITDNNKITLRNNSIYLLGATGAGGALIDFGGTGTGHVVTNNLLMFGASGPGTVGNCFAQGMATASYATWNNNLCFNAYRWVSGYGTTLATSLTAFNAATGFDANSLTSSPLLVAAPTSGNNWSMAIQATSPAIAAGNTGATVKAPRDYTTCARPSPPAIGAYEYFASACGTKPAGSGTQLR